MGGEVGVGVGCEVAAGVAKRGRDGPSWRHQEFIITPALAVAIYREAFAPDQPEIIRDLAGRDLACWCPLSSPCHGDVLLELAKTHDGFATLEDNVVAGGAGSGVAELLADADIAMPILHLGLPDAFIDHGDPAFLLSHVGLDAGGIAKSVRARFDARGTEPWAKPAA